MTLQQIDLAELAEASGAERAFVSLYLAGPDSLEKLADREKKVLRLLADQPEEREHFEESLAMIRRALDEHGVNGGMALFASWAADFLVGYPLEVEPPDLLWVDSSPYIRPLAQLQDEVESFIAVTADASGATIHVVASSVPQEVKRIRGEVKNRVKKGGWSQKRYQRRRSNEMLHYAKEVGEVVTRLVDEEGLERIVLLGSKETIGEIDDVLPERIRELVVREQAVDLDQEDEELMETAREAVHEQHKEDDASLWDQIRGEALSHGLAALGPRDVLHAVQEGRVDVMVVERDAEISGMRCRDCELLAYAKPQQCPRCNSDSVFEIDLVNELVELLALTGAHADFVDPIPGLAEAGSVAALLRY